MEKNNAVKEGQTPCDYCTSPAVIHVGGKLCCGLHAPADGEKRAFTADPTIKSAIDELVSEHLK